MSKVKTRTCRIGGEAIKNPTPDRRDLVLDVNSGVDAIATQIGHVCAGCLPAYEAANDKFSRDLYPQPKQPGKYIKRLVKDPAFVAAALRDYTRERIRYTWSEFSGEEREWCIEWENLMRQMKSECLRGINLKQYMSLDRADLDDHCGLELSRALGCFKEEERTIKFIQGVLYQLRRLDREYGRQIEMVDAGCGPVPILGLMAALMNDNVKVTCIEVNKVSAQMAEQIIRNFGLEDRVRVVVADAMHYQHDLPVDLLVSETMYSALTEEPMAQILANLGQQLSPDGGMVPESTTVEVGISKADERFKVLHRIDPRSVVGSAVFEQKPIEVLRLTRDNLFTVVKFDLSVDDIVPGEYGLIMKSTVGLGDGIELGLGESVITSGVVLKNTVKVGEDTTHISVEYVAGTIDDDIFPNAVTR